MLTKRIDSKHHIEVTFAGVMQYISVVKTSSGMTIPADEPLFLLRGRDKLALATLEFYRTLCDADGTTQYHLDGMDEMLKRFKEFAATSPTMKQPGCTMGK